MAKHILVVDDSISIRQMVEVTLLSANYQVSLAKDGKEAFDMCRINTYNFVLTDQNMPRMDGITLIKSLRSLPAYQRIPIIMLTTEASNGMKLKGKEAGATGWMVKPFNPAKLLELTAKVLG
ncbi:response regulator [Psychromonas aquimarina]|uniref:response regulator n=1 Tax=Psychromonas aquimarina TaxID=444919 RepID=UPI0004235C39|nr:response regulator [Psychromonas aquimarina]